MYKKMMVEIWDEFEDEIKMYQMVFSITMLSGIFILYLCT